MLAVVIGKCKMREWILVYTLPLVMASLLPRISRLCPTNLCYRGDCNQREADLVAADRRRADERAVRYVFAFSIVYLFSPFAASLAQKELFS